MHIQASYNPVLGEDGKPFMVVTFCADVTDAKLASIEAAARTEAMSNSTCVMELDGNGRILSANDLKLRALGLKGRLLKVAHSSRGAWRLARTGSLHLALNNERLRRHGFLMPSDLAATM